MDGPLAGFQAADGINGFLKWYILEQLCVRMKPRIFVNAVMAISLIIQWPFMPNMYALAPRPYAHIGAEVGATFATVMGLWHLYRRGQAEAPLVDACLAEPGLPVTRENLKAQRRGRG